MNERPDTTTVRIGYVEIDRRKFLVRNLQGCDGIVLTGYQHKLAFYVPCLSFAIFFKKLIDAVLISLFSKSKFSL